MSVMDHIAVGKSTTKAKKTAAAKAKTTGKKRRIRRNPEQLKAEAVKVLGLIKKAGKEGIGGAEIRRSVPGVGQNIKAFVAKDADVKVKTTGQKVKMRYHAA